jgi:MerR family redox-sensitive transcriptional activator SoxR
MHSETIVDQELLTIGAVVERTGVAHSALRFYEREGLIQSVRTESGHRRYPREIIRRISFIRVAQEVGLSLDEIRQSLSSLPASRTPSQHDWERLATSWRPRLDHQIAVLERLRDRLTGCIGCGCLSMKACRLLNPGDRCAALGPGPHYVVDDDPIIGSPTDEV